MMSFAIAVVPTMLIAATHIPARVRPVRRRRVRRVWSPISPGAGVSSRLGGEGCRGEQAHHRRGRHCEILKHFSLPTIRRSE